MIDQGEGGDNGKLMASLDYTGKSGNREPEAGNEVNFETPIQPT